MRRFALAGAAVTIALGLTSRALHLGIAVWDKSLGDVLYAIMVGFFVLAARPTLRPPAIGAATFAICFAIELFQLTGIPARQHRLLRFALGSAFAWHDVACYVVGALLVAALCRLRADRDLRDPR